MSPWNNSPRDEPRWLLTGTGTALAALLVFATLTVSVDARWPVAVLDGSVCCLAALWAAAFLIHPFRLFLAVDLLPLAAAPVWAAAQLALGLTVYRQATLDSLLSWASMAALAAIATRTLASEEARRAFRRMAAGFGSVLAAVSLAQLLTAPGSILWVYRTEYADGVLGPFVNPDHFASLMALLLPAALYECHRDRRWLAGAAAMMAAAGAGGSRAGVAILGAELLVFAWAAVNRHVVSWRQAAAGLLAAVALAAFLGGTGAIRRWRDLAGFDFRREVTASAIAMIEARPIAGHGLGTWETVYPGFARFDDGRRVDHAHNDWAEWTAEGGMVMLLLVAGIAVAAVRAALAAPWTLGAAAVLLHALVDYPLHKPAIMAWTMVFLAAGCAARRHEKKHLKSI